MHCCFWGRKEKLVRRISQGSVADIPFFGVSALGCGKLFVFFFHGHQHHTANRTQLHQTSVDEVPCRESRHMQGCVFRVAGGA